MDKPEYTADLIYQALEQICEDAGVKIYYQDVHDDAIDGEIWARADNDSCCIMMPLGDTFSSAEQASLILGHELAHIVMDIGSPDDPAERKKNEDTCDYVGGVFYRLAEMVAGTKLEQETFGTIN